MVALHKLNIKENNEHTSTDIGEIIGVTNLLVR